MQDRPPRLRVLKGAKIVFNDGASVIDALARNVSAGGASLEIATTAGIPPEFLLQMSGNAERPCRIRWRRSGRIGVQFLGHGSASA